jgi:hypothetical protein
MQQRVFTYQPSRTGILLIDPHNGFPHPKGNAWPRAKEVAGGVHLFDNITRALKNQP